MNDLPAEPDDESLTLAESRIDCAMLKDRHALRKAVQRLRGDLKRKAPCDRNWKRFVDRLNESTVTLERRRSAVPELSFPDDLPVIERIDEISETIRTNQVVIVSGETGSGKSTQLPKICLKLGRGVAGMIGHTQPRRIAARSVAARIADEMGTSLGKSVGYKVRFTDATDAQTHIKLMTDGILLAESQNDRYLDAYDTLIIDEAHERSLNIDFLLGQVRKLLPRRPELKLIITSATIDAERFSEHFDLGDGPAPVISVSGRTYPVEVRYRSLTDADGENDRDVERAICEAVTEIATSPQPEGVARGDILVFLPTERDIREAAKVLRGWPVPGDTPQRKTEILPLYGRLSPADQQKVFRTASHRRIVLATNVAESSVTVPGIRSVIDTGTARISRYSAHSKVQRLPVEPVSKASADQRKGRCGRIGPGLCIRLYSASDFEAREQFTVPEIQRTNLANVILQTKAFRLGRLEDFPFLDPPKPAAIKDGYRTLYEIGALDERQELTEIGRKLSKLPVDPRIGRIVIAGAEENCLRDVLIVASALEVQDPRDRPIEKQQQADEAHAKFLHDGSDFIAYLKIWDFYFEQQEKLSKGQLRKACRQNFLNFNRMREWQDVHRQLSTLSRESGLKPTPRRIEFTDGSPSTARGDSKSEQESRTAAESAIHRALLTGLLSNVIHRSDQYEYTGSGGKKLHIWPGSACFSERPKWAMAAEIVETSKRYARVVAKIDPEEIEPLAKHLTKSSHAEPHWSSKSGAPLIYENVTLFGLPIVLRRRIRYAQVDRAAAREMFIRHALVEEDWDSEAGFMRANRKLREDLEAEAARRRRPDLLLGEDAVFDFFDDRLPPHVTDGHHLRKWRKKVEAKQPDILHLQREHLWQAEEEPVDESLFPRSIKVGNLDLPLEYHLEPGSTEDGVTVMVPQEAVNQFHPRRLGWLVPGLLEEKITGLIRSLPKSKRRQFVPAPETAAEVYNGLRFGEGEILDVVAERLSRIAGDPIKPSDFDPQRLPNHLRMNVRVIDSSGGVLQSGRNLNAIRQEMASSASETFRELAETTWKQDGLKDWTFGELPTVIELERHGIPILGYPAVVDAETSVSLRLFDTKERAATETRSGLRRLFLLHHRKAVETQVNWMPNIEQMKLISMTLGGFNVFKQQVSELLADRALFGHKPAFPKTEDEWKALAKHARQRLPAMIQDVQVLIGPVLKGYHETRRVLDEKIPSAWQAAVDDMRRQLKHLAGHRFLIETPWEWLHQYPRYFEGIRQRFRKLKDGRLAKDRELQEQIRPRWQQYLQHEARLAELSLRDPRFEYYRWMLEEFRISLFAQSLRTAIPVSEPRLDKQWEKVAPIEI